MRNLHDYRNDDGTQPNGNDDGTDDSGALRRALEAGAGVVQIDPGFYRFDRICVPEHVTLQGSGPGTIVRSTGEAPLFFQEHTYRWSIRDMTLDGEASGDWHTRRDSGRSGIRIEHCKSWTISDVHLQNFDGPALQVTRNDVCGPASGWSDGGNLERITAERNYVGIHFGLRGEYGNATQLNCYHNVIGTLVHAGNVKLTASNFCTNITGLSIEDRENGSHGSIANCLINHNEEIGLYCRNVDNGMIISNCCIFAGGLVIEDCKGINLTSGIISCDVRVTGKAANRIAGNYIIPGAFAFEMSPKTLLHNNFTDAGPWQVHS